jgi:hypothetical protein
MGCRGNIRRGRNRTGQDKVELDRERWGLEKGSVIDFVARQESGIGPSDMNDGRVALSTRPCPCPCPCPDTHCSLLIAHVQPTKAGGSDDPLESHRAPQVAEGITHSPLTTLTSSRRGGRQVRPVPSFPPLPLPLPPPAIRIAAVSRDNRGAWHRPS